MALCDYVIASSTIQFFGNSYESNLIMQVFFGDAYNDMEHHASLWFLGYLWSVSLRNLLMSYLNGSSTLSRVSKVEG